MIKDKQITLSICIPTYNRCERVFNTVEEILHSYDEDDIEIVVIDDCSADNTIGLLKTIRDKRLKIICNKTRLGQMKNQFFALWSGNGKYVKVLIDRDKMFVNRLKKFINILYMCSVAIIIEGCEKEECINANINAKGWYKCCTRTHPSSLTYKRSALHRTCKYNEILSSMEYKDTPYIYFPSIINVLLYYKYNTLLCLKDSYIYQQKGNTISGDYCIGGTDYYKEVGAEKRFALYYKIGLIKRGVKRNYLLYAGELRNATLWNWESNDIAKKRTGLKTKTKRENVKDNFLFWKHSYKFFKRDLYSQINIFGITLLNLLRILFWKNKILECIWTYFFKK